MYPDEPERSVLRQVSSAAFHSDQESAGVFDLRARHQGEAGAIGTAKGDHLTGVMPRSPDLGDIRA